MQQQVELVADNCNHADVQHIPPRTVVNHRESTTAAETCNGMDQLARDTGGRTFQATDLYAARAAFAEVAAEIGRQYSLGYYSTNKTRDGRLRQIRVDVRGIAGAQVSAREGYTRTQGE
jgi:VWFA-related protein